ncbi:MAG: hypothetical protein KUG75_06735 [Pseudomonadales bacterium]|nr:hypothetical protein [Pseudomonadales bacterium]
MSNETENKDQFAIIQPTSLNLGGEVEPGVTPERTTQKISVPAIVSSILIIFGIWVFFFLPDNLSTPPTPLNTDKQNLPASTVNDPRAANPARPENSNIAPFEQLDKQRARKSTEKTLAEFVKLQIKLEDSMQVKLWATDAYAEAIAIANQGDALFIKTDYKASMFKYQQGSDALQTLVNQGDSLFSKAILEAKEALAQLDAATAKKAFKRAQDIHPGDPELQKGLIRANNMPQALKARKMAQKYLQNKQYLQAKKAFQKVQSLDPGILGIEQQISDITLAINEQNFRKYISEAYAALNAENFEKAEKSFQLADKIKPGHASITAGQRQLKSAILLSSIAAIKATALSHIAAEQWTELPATYKTALKLDANLKFAKDGLVQARKRALIDIAMDNIIAQPEALSSDSIYTEAQLTYNRALKISNRGPRLQSQIQSVKTILDIAASPIPVQLKSDNLTEVSIVRRGRVGIFRSKTIDLRPGSYIFTGSRPGYRDIRKSIDITHTVNSIVVQCEEAI